ncbi:MAG: PP2C family protein-serine/threonine phosphatase, partial [Acidimicrobiales bacterium]
IAQVRSGHAAAAASSETLGEGKRRFDTLRGRVETLGARLERETSKLSRQVRAQDRRTFELVALITAVVMMLLGLGRRALGRWVTSPIDVLVSEVRRVADGDLDHRVPSAGPAEIASLAGDVEAMRRRLRDELEEARQVRQSLADLDPLTLRLRAELAPSVLSSEHHRVAARFVPARGVLAGDWYDVIEAAPGRLAAAIVDISGHGAQAGIFALRVKHLLLPALRAGRSPSDALAAVAAQLGDTGEQFATALVLDIELESGWCRWASAGHPPALRHRDGVVHQLGPTGPILGPFPGAWESRSLQVAPGDLFVLYTDGIPEARTAGGGRYGTDTVVEQVSRHGSEDPEEVAERIISAVREAADGPLEDDATVVVLGIGELPVTEERPPPRDRRTNLPA